MYKLKWHLCMSRFLYIKQFFTNCIIFCGWSKTQRRSRVAASHSGCRLTHIASVVQLLLFADLLFGASWISLRRSGRAALRTWLLAYSAYSPELSLPARPSLLSVSLFRPPVMFRMHLRHDVTTLIRLMLTNNTNAPIANRIRPPTMTPICAEKESITTKKGYLILDHAVMTGTFTFKATFKQRFSLFCYSNVKWTARCPISRNGCTAMLWSLIGF